MGNHRRRKGKPGKRASGPPQIRGQAPLLDPFLLKLLGLATLGHFVLWVVVGSLLGRGFVALIATPLWGLSLFVIAKWDRTRTRGTQHSLREMVGTPLLSYSTVLAVVISIFLAHNALMVLIMLYLHKAESEAIDSAPDTVFGFISAMSENRKIMALILGASYLGHAIGGIVAGLVANRKVTKPYTHAVIGSLAYTLLMSSSQIRYRPKIEKNWT